MRVLLCPPTFYDIEYEINPWMHVDNKVNKEKVLEEYRNLKSTYQSLGLDVLEIAPVKGLPDMVYAANFGFVKNNLFIKSNFKFPQRQSESIYSKRYFESLGFKIAEMPDDISFEGQGDLLTANGKYFMGYGKRSSLDAKKYLEEFLGSEIIEFKLSDPYFYHLDMSFAPLDKDTVVINKNSFEKEEVGKIYKNFKNVIETGESDNKIFACNLVVVDKNIVVGKGVSGELKNRLEKFGFKIYEVEMNEYRRGGGSIKCLTLEFF
ncbi:MAG: arginine deiminase-related protein [bacterium]|nr:arginine deiminase-related protein [bacterium]